MSKNIKVAVIGTGKLGSRHAEMYSKLPGVTLVGVCDIIEERAREIADRFHVHAFTDHRQLLGQVDAASIVVPSHKHYEISKVFLRNGVHLLIEKPITTVLSEADELLKIAKAKKCILQVGHIERFNSAFRAIKGIIHKPRFIECHRLGPYDPRVADTGVTLDLMIHDIDIVLDLMNSPIKSVDAVGAFILSKTEDIANVRIRFKNNSVCNLTASRLTQEPTRKIRIFQDDAHFTIDYVNQEAVIFKKKQGRMEAQKIDITKSNSLKEELQHFIDCIHSGQRPLVSGQEARQALALGLQISKMIRSNHNHYVAR